MQNLDFSVAYWGFEPEHDTCICVESGPLARILIRQSRLIPRLVMFNPNAELNQILRNRSSSAK